MTMSHPGLPEIWAYVIGIFMLLAAIWVMSVPAPGNARYRSVNLNGLPFVGMFVRFLTASHWPLLILKIAMVAIFLLVIVAGLEGTQIPERNIATVLTWNIWWAGLVVAIFFLGSAWCAVCPWDALANWFVRRRLWFRAIPNGSLNLKVPGYLRNVLPALFMFIGLTWLELGVGVTINPYVTALLSLLMVVLATVSLAIFEGKAFCRFACPIGRTVGFYSQLAPVELRPIDPDICANCKTLECYHGNDQVEPCPTHLVMGTLKQNTYCTSCGNCTQSCPDHNVSWRLRPYSVEAVQDARPQWHESWFMLGLLTLTSFHGITMLPYWEQWISDFGRLIGDSGQLLMSFSVGMMIAMLIPILLYCALLLLMRWMNTQAPAFKSLFTSLAFISLPLAFAYHLAHNLNHLVREGSGLTSVLANPLGAGTAPMSMMEKHNRHFDMLISEQALFVIQGGLMIFGFWIAMKVVRHRGSRLVPDARWGLLPIVIFAVAINSFHLWMLMQPMIMRM